MTEHPVIKSLHPFIRFGSACLGGIIVLLLLLFAFIILIPSCIFYFGILYAKNNISLMVSPLLLGNRKVNLETKFREMSDSEFVEWFVGFVDGEGCFFIDISKKNVISFILTIGLHIEDLSTLEFIKERLNCGKIYTTEKIAKFDVKRINDIQNILIPLLEKFTLNGTKYLDYLAFKEAIAIKFDESLSNSDKLKLITDLKSKMNTKRVNFEMPSTHTIRVTPYWLLGLIEGEGCFSLVDSKNIGISFSLTLTSVQAPLIHAIKNFLDSYSVDDTHLKLSPQYLEIISQRTSIYVKNKSTANSKPSIEIQFRQINFIVNTFIPMLSNLSFVTKKYKDFLDWAFIASLIYKGKHLTEAGKKLILKIRQGMNNSHLFTFKHLDNETKEISPSLINEVLDMEDIYVTDKDGLRINSLTGSLVKWQLFYILAEGFNGEIIIFKDTQSCADYFKVAPQTINVKLNKRVTVFDSKKVGFKLSRKPLG